MKKNIILLVAAFIILEIYVYQAFKTLTHNTWLRVAYWVVTIAVYAFVISEISNFRRSDRDQHKIQIMTSILVIFVIPKILIAALLLIDDIIRVSSFGFNSLKNNGTTNYPERRKFLSLLGIGSAALLSLAFIDGIIFGKYRYKVRALKIKIKNLPQSFKDYKIVQISDVHSGSFFHPEKLQHAIDLINEQNADLILFTGDMVNNYAEEFEPFIPLFKTIKSKDGKLAILGNHDYGEYAEWSSAEAKAENLKRLISYETLAGFDMLRNEHRIIEKNGEKLYILGVENWGIKPFPQYGDLDKAAASVPENAAKILMSHDPTHFDYKVKEHPADISLTLSGHTHGMQFGIDLKNFKWSPVKYKYPKWADLYESKGKYLYVNRGFGVIGYPGRVGIDPEITVFTLI